MCVALEAKNEANRRVPFSPLLSFSDLKRSNTQVATALNESRRASCLEIIDFPVHAILLASSDYSDRTVFYFLFE